MVNNHHHLCFSLELTNITADQRGTFQPSRHPALVTTSARLTIFFSLNGHWPDSFSEARAEMRRKAREGIEKEEEGGKEKALASGARRWAMHGGRPVHFHRPSHSNLHCISLGFADANAFAKRRIALLGGGYARTRTPSFLCSGS